MGQRKLITKKEAKYIAKHPEYLALIVGISFLLMGYLDFGALYYIFGGIITIFALIIYAKIFYDNYIKQKRKEEAIIKHGLSKIDNMDGHEFEHFVSDVLKTLGYKAYVTKASGDYGADVIAEKNGKKIAIQTKRYSKNVPYRAVQEAFSGMKKYKCDEAWVITSANDFTRQAKLGANDFKVKLLTKGDFALLLENEK
jgi:restriction system protein